MALIKCPECGKEVSDQAKSCIHCGFPLDTATISPQSSSDDRIKQLVADADACREHGNYVKALALYEEAGELGDMHSQVWAGNFYGRGLGVEKNYRKAFIWFERAATQGSADAMNNLAVMYMDGKGTAKDYEKAKALLRKAIGLGNQSAEKNLDILDKRMSAPSSNNQTNFTTSQTNQSGGTSGKTILWLIAGVVALVLMLSMCSSGSGDDGKCDVAGCTRSATCHYGDMEMCTKHYAEWSDKAYDYNHRND